MPLFLREQDVEQLLPMAVAIDLLEAALRRMGEDRAQNRPRQRVRTGHVVLNVMPASDPDAGYLGYKAYRTTREGARFHFHLFDGHSGEYLAVIQANRLGQIRTGAASGVATRLLGRKDADTVGLIGTGWQAESQLEAMCAVRPIRAVRCYSRGADRRSEFAARMSQRLGVPVSPVETAQEAAIDASILVTITSAATPVLAGAWIAEGAHINAAGANATTRRELDDQAIIRSSPIFVDSIEQAQVEAGDLIEPIGKGFLSWANIQELGSLVAGKAAGRASAEDITLFKSTGIALEDVAVAGYVFERARQAGLGTNVEL